MNQHSQAPGFPESSFRIQRVAMHRPCVWIREGWRDFLCHPGASLGHGLLITGIGWLILSIVTTHVYLVSVAISSFLLVGPILASGLCELSRLDERRLPASFDASLEILGRNQASLWHFALTLTGLAMGWWFISALIVHGIFGFDMPTLGELTWGQLSEVIQPQQALLFMLSGGFLAFFVFILSVVTVPAIIDQHVSAGAAMRMSIQVFIQNVPAMLVWAGLIVLLTGFGFITFLWAMIVIYPLLGHATWHAYRDLVD